MVFIGPLQLKRFCFYDLSVPPLIQCFILFANMDKQVRKNTLQLSITGGWISKRNVQQSSHLEIKLG